MNQAAAAVALGSFGRPVADRASRAIYQVVFDGVTNSDFGGNSLTTLFTGEVIRRVTAKLELFTALA